MNKKDIDHLVKAATAASRKAYAPYSKFHVGAALQTVEGDTFTGCNVENASYGLTICAERNALFAAVAAGRKKFKAIAIVADGKAKPFPCGACRQVFAEFCGPDFPVIIASVNKPAAYEIVSLGALLPNTFKF